MSDILGAFEQAVLVAVVHLRGEGYGRSILKQVEARLDRDVTASAVTPRSIGWKTRDWSSRAPVKARRPAAGARSGTSPSRHSAFAR